MLSVRSLASLALSVQLSQRSGVSFVLPTNLQDLVVVAHARSVNH